MKKERRNNVYNKLKLKSDFAFHNGSKKQLGMVSKQSDYISLIDKLDELVDEQSTELEEFSRP